MNINVIGRVKNTSLHPSKALLPLFEAIVNSLEAIEESNPEKGKVEVDIIRDRQSLPLSDNNIPPLICSFTISDDGIGFDTKNYDSFLTSDTTLKESKGGKGVGRFHWLKAFKKVAIDSVYKEKDSTYSRTFEFEQCEEGVVNHKLTKTKAQKQNRTRVQLLDFKPQYKESCEQNIDKIAQRTIEHCLVYFISEKCPQITLQDPPTTMNLNEIYSSKIKKEAESEDILIDQRKFNLQYFKLYGTEESDHRIHYCADGREVNNDKLAKPIPDLYKRLSDESGNEFIFSIYLTGDYLDQKVNSDRTGFNFPQDSDLFGNDISWDQLQDNVFSAIKKHLEQYISPVREEKLQVIKAYVMQKNPSYRSLLKYGKDYLDRIPPGLSEKRLDQELSKANFELTYNLREASKEFLEQDIDSIEDFEEYKNRLNQFIETYDDFGKSQLAAYVAHRKVILEFFEKALAQKGNGKYRPEEYIHQLICPRGTTSDDIPYERLNLWVLDERLSYHRYLSSDKPLSSFEEGMYEGSKRCDLAIFNHSLAFTEDESPYDSIIIVEFKRPARDDYSEKQNPIGQIIAYIEEFRKGKVKDKNGRPIPDVKNRKFYCYIVCDRTPKIVEQAKRWDFKDTPDEMGFFLYHTGYNAYIEIMPFDRLLQDAKKRNRILFEKLNI